MVVLVLLMVLLLGLQLLLLVLLEGHTGKLLFGLVFRCLMWPLILVFLLLSGGLLSLYATFQVLKWRAASWVGSCSGARIAKLLVTVLQVVLVVLLGAPLVGQHGLDGATFVVRCQHFGVRAWCRAQAWR